ncbi:hypothetical protein GIB67_013852, partial [Kingdonia uniflora]
STSSVPAERYRGTQRATHSLPATTVRPVATHSLRVTTARPVATSSMPAKRCRATQRTTSFCSLPAKITRLGLRYRCFTTTSFCSKWRAVLAG